MSYYTSKTVSLPFEETLARITAALREEGFGVWHLLDSVVSHWVTGIHRIKMDSDVPLLWDLIWFVLFGVVPVVVGWIMRSRSTGPITGGHFTAALMVVAVLVAAPVAALPPTGAKGAVVLFKPGISPGEMIAAVHSVAGRMVWTDSSGALWAIDLDNPRDARELYGRGALLVSNSLIPAGCLSWSRPF